jgi:hypothetical protein
MERVTMKVCLVSCSRRKLDRAAEAQKLYSSPLFQVASRYASQHFDHWYILSALHGLVEPIRVIEPYDVSLNNMGKKARQAWSEGVVARIEELVPHGSAITILAGENYREFLSPALAERGYSISVPMEHLALGKQVQWLQRHTYDRHAA